MFTQGEKFGLKEIFDKSKASNENSNIELVEIRIILQLLQQRVSDLNDSLLSNDKIINSHSSGIKSLFLDHYLFCKDLECLKAEANSRFIKLIIFIKMSSDNFKKNQTD